MASVMFSISRENALTTSAKGDVFFTSIDRQPKVVALGYFRDEKNTNHRFSLGKSASCILIVVVKVKFEHRARDFDLDNALTLFSQNFTEALLKCPSEQDS